MILSIDLGTTTGWASAMLSGYIESGSVSFATKRHEGGGMRYMKFRKWLESEFAGRVKEVYYEEVRRHQGTSAAHVYGAFEGQLTAWCEENNIPYSSVPVGTIKLFSTGKGNANKQMMINAAVCSGFDVVDDNQADAIHLLRYVLAK